MGRKNDILEVRTFSALSIRYQDKPLILSKNMTGKMVHLLIALLYNRKGGVHREELLGTLYEDGDMVQAANSFRALLFRLRKNLVAAGLPAQEYVIFEGGVYRWNNEAMDVQLDAEVFESLVLKAEGELDDNKKQEYLEQACDAYRGEFLPSMVSDEWILQMNHKFQKLYFGSVRKLFAILKEKKDYRRLLAYCDRVTNLYPYEEWQLAKLECLMNMKEYEQAMQFYSDITRLYQQEFNSKPPESLRKMRSQIRKYIDEEIYSIGEIRGKFIESEELEGAAYCDTVAFATIYRYLSQVVNRTETPTSLMLVTLVNHDHVPLQQPDLLKTARDVMAHVIRTSARGSDLYTRFGRNQFLILLIGCSIKDGAQVAQRIRAKFGEAAVSRDVEMCYTIDPVDAVTH